MEELSEQDLNLIDRFITGAASAEDLQTLEIRKPDPVFAEYMAFAQSMSRVTAHQEEQILRQEFSKIDRRQQDRNPYVKYLLWAVVMLLVCALVYLIYTQFRSPQSTPQQYFAEFYTPMPNLVAPIEQGAAQVTAYQEAFRSYERREYDTAIRQFEQLEIQDDATRFYYALSLLAIDRTDEAIPLLTQVREIATSDYAHAAQWYLVLGFLKAGDINRVKYEIDNLMQNDQHRYRNNALALQKKIN